VYVHVYTYIQSLQIHTYMYMYMYMCIHIYRVCRNAARKESVKVAQGQAPSSEKGNARKEGRKKERIGLSRDN